MFTHSEVSTKVDQHDIFPSHKNRLYHDAVSNFYILNTARWAFIGAQDIGSNINFSRKALATKSYISAVSFIHSMVGMVFCKFFFPHLFR